MLPQTASSANKAMYLPLLLSAPVGVSLPQNSGKFLKSTAPPFIMLLDAQDPIAASYWRDSGTGQDG